ncbi:FCD domain-containing protein [Pseudonocardia sp.]|uniref:GntR family transcriptional regulator n=1 Tax=Pseudonocardia sp. TaxID=60912 RepID=UPI00262A8569|nr:FCD domain-containing protein [Pseudonocardia sp.]
MVRRAAGRTRTDLVHDRLRSDILDGHLRPGQRLKFPDLCEQYDASVGVAREALARLAAQGLVRGQSRQGYQVAPLSQDDLSDLTSARVEVESLVLHRSVVEGDVEWEATAIGAHHVLERAHFTAPDDPRRVTDQWADAHAAFHNALLAGCTNRRLMQTAASLRAEAELYRRWSVSLGHEPDRDISAEHRGLLDAAVARDPDLAAERLRQHIAHTAQLLITCADEDATDLR